MIKEMMLVRLDHPFFVLSFITSSRNHVEFRSIVSNVFARVCPRGRTTSSNEVIHTFFPWGHSTWYRSENA
jgi:hypothetical protein